MDYNFVQGARYIMAAEGWLQILRLQNHKADRYSQRNNHWVHKKHRISIDKPNEQKQQAGSPSLRKWGDTKGKLHETTDHHQKQKEKMRRKINKRRTTKKKKSRNYE